MSSILSLDYGSLGYPVVPEYATPFFPSFKGHARGEHLPAGCQFVYPGLAAYKQQASSSQTRSLLPYSKYSSYYPVFGAMLEAQPSAFRGHKSSGKPAFEQPATPDHAPSQLYYNDRHLCTCNCALTTPRIPSNHSEYYSWFFPSDRHDDTIGLRLSSLTARRYPMIARHSTDKRSAPKRFQCTHCEKSFGKSSHLRDHIRTHTGDRPYRCDYCGKTFTQYSNLRTHIRIHTGERPYRCNHCNKSFTQAVTLRSHTRTHLGEKAYNCKQNAKPLACFSGLKDHIRVREATNQTDLANIKQEPIDDVIATQNKN